MELLLARDPIVPLSHACDVLGMPRGTARRRLAPRRHGPRRPRPPSPRRLSPEERQQVLDTLHLERFEDQTPRQVYAELLDEGRYLASPSTMYRILADQGETRERRNQRDARSHAVPRLEARKPNEVWTWDISKLATTTPGTFLNLYLVLDLYSRYPVAWMVAERENSALAKQLFATAIERYDIAPGTITVHNDRGAPMTAHRYFDLMGELGITLSHSRPRVSNDNPFSEAQFKTQKYQPDYPDRFRHPAHATAWHADYFDWYNFSHHHCGLAGYTPEQVFTGRLRHVAQHKQAALDAQFARHPERFVAGHPKALTPLQRVELNPVTPEELAAGVSTAVNFPTLPAVVQKSTLSGN